MGQVQDKLASLGETVMTMASNVSKSFSSFGTAPKHPLTMPMLSDGRSQDQLRTEAEMMYNMDTKTCINFAFVGPNNDVKLALINSCRYVAECHPGEGGITSPNNVAVQWVHCDPSYNHLRFWELSDTAGSFVNRCLYAFDAVIIVVTEMLRQSDLQLIRDAGSLNPPTPVLIVRSEMNHFIDKNFGLEADSADVIKGKTEQGKVLRENIKDQLLTNGINCECTLASIYLVSPPGMLAARAVNFDGMKYIWDEFDFMQGLLNKIVKRRY